MNRSLVFSFRGDRLLLRKRDGAYELPGATAYGDDGRVVGEFGGVPCVAVDLGAEGVAGDDDGLIPAGWEAVGLRQAGYALGQDLFRMAGRALQYVQWDRTHRFCSRCAAPTEEDRAEPSKVCPSCGLRQFPRLAPAVIVLVHDGERMLLGRSPHFPPGVYSTLAGFVEPGESLEDAVRREVREEASVELGAVRYFDSQPWPFPHSLMVGFTAEWKRGEARPQPGEIEDVRWFAPEALPVLPSPISIARALVDAFLAERGIAPPEQPDPWLRAARERPGG